MRRGGSACSAVRHLPISLPQPGMNRHLAEGMTTAARAITGLILREEVNIHPHRISSIRNSEDLVKIARLQVSSADPKQLIHLLPQSSIDPVNDNGGY